MAEPILKKARRAPWPEKCKLLAMKKYVENLSILTGKFKGCGAGGVLAEEKERCWAGVAESINAISDEPICVDQLKKQITNIRQRANEKLDNSRQTGGGPPPKVYPAEKLWIENSSKRASVQGLQICLDSEGSMNGQKAEYQLLEKDSMTCGAIPCKDKDQKVQHQGSGSKEKTGNQQEYCDDVEDEDVYILDKLKKVKPISKKKETAIELELHNLKLDNKRIHVNTVRIEKETKKMEKEIECLELKKQLLQIRLSKETLNSLNVLEF